MPLELLQLLRFPFFGNFTNSSIFQSVGMTSVVQILFKRQYKTSSETQLPSFQASAGMLSRPAVLPFFRFLRASFTSALETGPVLIASGGASYFSCNSSYLLDSSCFSYGLRSASGFLSSYFLTCPSDLASLLH